jgi:hypothetical protein
MDLKDPNARSLLYGQKTNDRLFAVGNGDIMKKSIFELITAMFAALLLSIIYVPVQAAEFTADWINMIGGETNNGKIYVKDDVVCIEVLKGPELGIIVTDQKKRSSIVMLPDQKIYMEVPKNLSILEPDNDLITGAEKKSMGTEMLNGRSCDKYQYVKTGTDTVIVTQWIAKDLQYPVKIVYHGEGGNTAEVKNIQEGPVDAAMFQVRPGYTKKEVGKVGKLTKEKTGKKDEKTSAGNLRLNNIVFCSTRPTGYMAYSEQPAATYKTGNTVWVYMNLKGLSYHANPDGTNEVWLKLHLSVKEPNGNVLLDQELCNEHKNYRKEYNLDEMFFRINLNTVREMAEGRYVVELDLKDNLAGKQASESSAFILKK